MGTLLFKIGSKSSTWTSHSPFHAVPTVWDHWSLEIAILANLGSFWGPLGQNWGHPASQNWFKIFDLDLPQPVPPSFHAVPTVWDHQSLQIAILADLGCFWAVFGPWRSQIWQILCPVSGTRPGAPWELRKMCPLTPTAKKISDPPLTHCALHPKYVWKLTWYADLEFKVCRY